MALIDWSDSLSVKVAEIDEEHKKEHAAFVKKVSGFRQGYETGRLTLTMDLMDFLKNWLVGHIQGSDKKYSHFSTSTA